jgi:hypothetical protein
MRLLLSVVRGDRDAVDTLTDEMGECGECWRRIAWRLAEVSSIVMTALADQLYPDSDDKPAIVAELIENALLGHLDRFGEEPN